MGCFWSKDDEVPIRSTRSAEETRRSTLRRISIPQGTVTVTHYPSYYASGINQLSRLQTPRTNQNIIVPIATPRNNNSVIRQRASSSGPVRVNPIGEIKCRPATVYTRKPESKLRAINKNKNEGPKFGQYKCKNCGRFWNSRICWPDEFQMCKSCRKPTYAYNHRELVPADTGDKTKEHPKEFCGKCKKLGHYCNTKDYKPKKYC